MSFIQNCRLFIAHEKGATGKGHMRSAVSSCDESDKIRRAAEEIDKRLVNNGTEKTPMGASPQLGILKATYRKGVTR